LLNELGIAVTAYGVLSRGLLSGSSITGAGDMRNRFPRFSADNLARNQHLVARLKQIAETWGVTPSQLAIAWVLAKGESIVPLMGSRTRAQLAESLAALEVKLSPTEIADLEASISPEEVAGTRYDEHQMKVLDSEK
jgi:aryl-alcohol dehydrogenase-like predicted oxidoreductase